MISFDELKEALAAHEVNYSEDELRSLVTTQTQHIFTVPLGLVAFLSICWRLLTRLGSPSREACLLVPPCKVILCAFGRFCALLCCAFIADLPARFKRQRKSEVSATTICSNDASGSQRCCASLLCIWLLTLIHFCFLLLPMLVFGPHSYAAFQKLMQQAE